METPAEKEILRDDPNAEQSGLLERSEASTIGFTPDTGKISQNKLCQRLRMIIFLSFAKSDMSITRFLTHSNRRKF